MAGIAGAHFATRASAASIVPIAIVVAIAMVVVMVMVMVRQELAHDRRNAAIAVVMVVVMVLVVVLRQLYARRGVDRREHA